jgi:hypothetical protein
MIPPVIRRVVEMNHASACATLSARREAVVAARDKTQAPMVNQARLAVPVVNHPQLVNHPQPVNQLQPVNLPQLVNQPLSKPPRQVNQLLNKAHKLDRKPLALVNKPVKPDNKPVRTPLALVNKPVLLVNKLVKMLVLLVNRLALLPRTPLWLALAVGDAKPPPHRPLPLRPA